MVDPWGVLLWPDPIVPPCDQRRDRYLQRIRQPRRLVHTTDTYILKDLRFFDRLRPPVPELPPDSGTATRVGPEFGVISLATLAPFDELVSFNLVLASLVGLDPVSVAFLCREVLDLDLEWTLLGALSIAGATPPCHSSTAISTSDSSLRWR